MFSRVLVPIDIRFIPKVALRAAAALAQGGAELTLVYVNDIASEFPEAAFVAIAEGDVESHEGRVRQTIGNVLALLSEYGASATTRVVQGSPVHRTINHVARDIGADAILMGTHGRRGLSRALRGSVTEDVMREADIPVVVIRESSSKPFLPLFEEQRRHI